MSCMDCCRTRQPPDCSAGGFAMARARTVVVAAISLAYPLLVYLAGLFAPVPLGAAFPVALGLSGLALFGLGAAKVLVTQNNPWRSGLEMLLVGGMAAGVAYLVGALLKGLGGGA